MAEDDSRVVPTVAPGDTPGTGGRTHLVGIGASGGDLQALDAFFSRLPTGTGAAFLVAPVPGTPPVGGLEEFLARHAPLPVQRGVDGQRLRAERVYVIPPARDVRIEGDRLHLTPRGHAGARASPLSLDVFFRSLAEGAGDRAIGVILAGDDGDRGARSIKEAGGLVLAHDAPSARFRDALRVKGTAGSVDVVLPPAQMGRELRAYVASSARLEERRKAEPGPLGEIVDHLKRRKGLDLAHDKDRTVLRRILRRVGIARANDVGEYRDVLLSDPGELDRLFDDLLIATTEFFRDPGAFEALTGHVPGIVRLAGEETLRVWVAACASGEEAYSLAILLDEHRRRYGTPLDFEIHATDVHPGTVQRAGEGTFPARIREVLSPPRLKAYFQPHEHGYQVVRSLRDRVVFAPHDLTCDPPRTRMHLVACRNALIYLTPAAQERVLRSLHSALAPNGTLLLGPSESLGALREEFEELDPRWKLYRKRRDVHLGPAGDLRGSPRGYEACPAARSAGVDLERVCSVLLRARASLAVVVDGEGRTLRVLDGSGRPGIAGRRRATPDYLGALEPPARETLTAALHRARESGRGVHCGDVRVPGGDVAGVAIEPLPAAGEGRPDRFVLLIDVHRPAASPAPRRTGAGLFRSERVRRLERELDRTREDLQTTIAELEATNDELQTANEALQSSNEELHSVNEVLYTVNVEHQEKIEELTELGEDVENLLRSTDIGTVFLDRELRIRKFTPQVADIVPILPSDVGRPILNLASTLRGVDLPAAAKAVLDGGPGFEQETEDQRGVPRLVRLLPYRARGEVGGVVVSFIDLTTVKEAQRSLRESEHRFQSLVEHLDQVFWTASADGSRFTYVSPRFEQLLGHAVEELYADRELWFRLVHEQDRDRVRGMYLRELLAGRFDVTYRLAAPGPSGSTRWIHAKGTPVHAPDGSVRGVVGFARDVTEQKELAAELENKAQTDSLTNLANRRGLESLISRELSRVERTGGSMTAVLVDVDDFKLVNDSLGHSTGDVVLQSMAKRMSEVLRPTDLLSRIGGDEFLAVLPETHLTEGVHVAERIRLAIADHPISVNDRPMRITASLGIAALPRTVVSIEEVLDATRQALATSKREGKNRVVAASDGVGIRCSVSPDAFDVATLTREGAIQPMAQSIRDVASDRLVGYEMLARGPRGPYRLPNDLFRLSHEENVLTLVDLTCFKTCLQASSAFGDDLLVFVNMFPSTLVDTPPERIIDLMAQVGDPRRFCVELSEQQFLGTPTYLVEAVRAMKAAGVRVAVDDVGYGRSSLEALVVLEPDVIKIAREFVQGADRVPSQRRGLDRLVGSTRSLTTTLVAEGVETVGERAVLSDLGIQLGQGYLWDRPCDPAEAARSH